MPAKNDKKTAAKAPSAAKASSTARASSAVNASPRAGAVAPRRSRELSRPQLESLRQKLSRQYHGSR